MDIVCESAIERVVVYARGAVVTRRVVVPKDLPEGSVRLRVPDVTAHAEPGSLRAFAEGSRAIVAVHGALHVPEHAPTLPRFEAELRELDAKRKRIEDEQRSLSYRRALLVETIAAPRLAARYPKRGLAGRLADAFASQDIVKTALAAVDVTLVAKAREVAEIVRERQRLEVAASQAEGDDRRAHGTPKLVAELTLGPASAAGDVAITFDYVIQEARWWPAYTARFFRDRTEAAIGLDAFVAQMSGEDWSAVALGLSTADLAVDARLPVLPVLRLGRAQTAPKRGYRPVPAGLDALFAGYDRAIGKPPGGPSFGPPVAKLEESDDEDEDVEETAAALAQTPLPPPPARMAPPGFGPPLAGGAAPPPVQAALRMPAPLPMSAPAPSRARMAAKGGARLSFGGELSAAAIAPPAPPTEPDDDLLDFDRLVLGDASDVRRRGRLYGAPRAPGVAGSFASTIAALTPPRPAEDARAARGRFDVRYDSEGKVDVPSGALVLRVALARAEATPRVTFRSVPRSAPEVYREAELENPFGMPLLGGPVDVSLDGTLLTVAALEAVDRGGTMRVSMGIEERLRIARNVRTDEHPTGLLRGQTTVEHLVDIDVASALGAAITIEIVERLPVPGEHAEITVKPLAASPPSETYSQADRGRPVRGGIRFRVAVPAGGKAKASYGYVVSFSAKEELVGGNRRE